MTHDIAELDLSVRSFNCLKKGGIHTIEQLKEMSDEELLSLRWFGLRCLNEVHERLKKWDGTPTYDDLNAENAKLRDLMYERAHRHAIQHMTEDELRIVATNALDENAELRELVLHIYTCMGNVDADGNHECFSCEYEGAECDYADLMRKLRIEV